MTHSPSGGDPFVCTHPLISGVSLGPVFLGRQLISVSSIFLPRLSDIIPVLQRATRASPKARDESPWLRTLANYQGVTKDKIIPTKNNAALVAEMKVSTFKHRTCGWLSAAEYGKTRRLLLDDKEVVLIWRCEILQCSGFPQSIRDITAIAEEILRKR